MVFRRNYPDCSQCRCISKRFLKNEIPGTNLFNNKFYAENIHSNKTREPFSFIKKYVFEKKNGHNVKERLKLTAERIFEQV